MFSLFQRNNKNDKKDASAEDLAGTQPGAAPIDLGCELKNDESLRQSIAAKLQNYRPSERTANFKGPNYYATGE